MQWKGNADNMTACYMGDKKVPESALVLAQDHKQINVDWSGEQGEKFRHSHMVNNMCKVSGAGNDQCIWTNNERSTDGNWRRFAGSQPINRRWVKPNLRLVKKPVGNHQVLYMVVFSKLTIVWKLIEDSQEQEEENQPGEHRKYLDQPDHGAVWKEQ